MVRIPPTAFLVPALALAVPGPASANSDMVEFVRSQVAVISQVPEVMDAIRASNRRTDTLAVPDLVAMDDVWRGEVGAPATPTIDAIIQTPASDRLRALADESGGIVTEIIVMDGRGMNAAASAITSDYWQGDEAKYTETYPRGADAVHVSEVEYDESTATYQVQVSMTVADPVSGEPAGAVTFGLDATAF